MNPRLKEAVIATKITVPTAPVSSLTRSRLAEIVSASAGKRLVLICAPAGYGKTTIMSQWAQSLGDEDRSLAWLTLDGADNDPGRLYYYLDLVLSARDVQTVAGTEIKTDRIRGVSRAHASLLAASLEHPGAPTTIFIDDFEAIDNTESQRLLEMLLWQLPPGVCMVVATRTKPQWKLAKLRVAGSLLEIDSEYLRLQVSEIAEFNRLPLAETVPEDVFERIVDKMEGWVAGVQLALLAIRDHPQPENFVERLLGRTEDIDAFLTEEVFNNLESTTQEFLLRTSILERFCGPLCEALTETTQGDDLIRKLVQKGLFVQSLDQQGQWYRYHNIFKDFLENRLARQATDDIRRLHKTAAKWFDDNGQHEEGVHHALAADDAELAAKLLSRCIRTMIKQGQLETVDRYVSRMGSDRVASYPEIIGGAAWAYTFLRRFAKLKEILEQEDCADNADVQTLQPLLAVFQDDLSSAYTQATSNLEHIPETLAFNRGVLLNIVAYCLVARSKYEEATARVGRAKAYHNEAGSTFGQAYSDVIAALIDRAQGNLSIVLEKLEGVERSDIARSVAVGFHAEVLYFKNRLAEAEQMLQRYFQLTVKNAPPDFVTLAYLVRARIAFAEQRFDRAYSIVEEGQHLGEKWPLPHMQRIMRWERVRFALLRGEAEAALEFAPTDGDESATYKENDSYLRLSDETTGEDIASLRLRIHTEPSFKLVAVLKKSIAVAERNRRGWRALQLQVLYAIAHDAVGEEERALRAMNDALMMGARIGAVRTFLDEGDRVEVILAALADRMTKQDHRLVDAAQTEFLCKLLGKQRQDLLSSISTTRTPQVGSADLTKREKQILGLLCQGLSNDQIGCQAYLSTNTVKWHLKRIYEKLGVKSRVEASAIARQMSNGQ